MNTNSFVVLNVMVHCPFVLPVHLHIHYPLVNACASAVVFMQEIINMKKQRKKTRDILMNKLCNSIREVFWLAVNIIAISFFMASSLYCFMQAIILLSLTYDAHVAHPLFAAIFPSVRLYSLLFFGSLFGIAQIVSMTFFLRTIKAYE